MTVTPKAPSSPTRKSQMSLAIVVISALLLMEALLIIIATTTHSFRAEALTLIAVISTSIGTILLINWYVNKGLVIHKNGSVSIVHSTGFAQLDKVLLALVTAKRDLQARLEQQRAEANLLLHRYEVLTESLAAAIVIRDADSTLTYCSPYTEVLTGYTIYEIYEFEGDFFESIIHVDDRENYRRALKVSSCGEAFQFRYRFTHRTGIEMWAETRTVPILNGNGEVVSSLSITLDVTGTVRYQQQVEEKNRDLQDFAYMVTHDLKNPINTIKGMSAVMREDFSEKLSQKGIELITHIDRAANRLEELATSVLEYSRISDSHSHLQPIELGKVIESVRMEFEPQLIATKATVKVDNLPTVLGDELKFYQIFSNLFSNAIKYRSPERPLEVTIAATDPRSTRRTEITISDNGRGIPAEKLQVIFRPFQRAHGKEIEGSGIGLACVKKLLEKLGGAISVTSTEGRGSTFTVSLRTGPREPKRQPQSIELS